MNNLNINDKVFSPKIFKAQINKAKSMEITPQNTDIQIHSMSKQAVRVYELYEKELFRLGAMDFNDLLFKTVTLFQTHSDILEQYQNKFCHIMVDEYQDTNPIQYKIVKMLSQKHKNLCVVGDEDQSIYSWRGADVRNILEFDKDFPHCTIIKLEQNYRSTQNIIKAASSMIRHNLQRKDKTLFSQLETGQLVTIKKCHDEYEEADFVVSEIKKLINQQKTNLKNCSIFYRTNAQSRVFEEKLRENSMAYQIFGSVKFYSRKEIKDIFSYMRLILNSKDDLAFRRVLNTPLRGIGKTTLEYIEIYANRFSLCLYEACELIVQKGILKTATAQKLDKFLNLIKDLTTNHETLSLEDLYLKILDKTLYTKKLQEEDSLESQTRLDNLEALSNAIKKFEKDNEENKNLSIFLEKMALFSETDQTDTKENSVSLMTLHLSKGLEFQNVFIVGNEEGLFPSFQSAEDEEQLEEERRLFYVGMTRARQNLIISYAQKRQVWGRHRYFSSSRFLKEIPQRFVQRISSEDKEEEEIIYNTNDSFVAQNSFPIKRGHLVKHPQFGQGRVLKTEGHGENTKVHVSFNGRPSKVFVAKYAKLKRIEI